MFTDFGQTRAFAISPASTLAHINAAMIACGLRLLFVAENDGKLDLYRPVWRKTGVLPARARRQQRGNPGQGHRAPLDRLETLQLDDAYKASVGDIVETIKSRGRQHLPVSRADDSERRLVAGMLSSTHIERHLGITIELSTGARSFADIGRALVSA